jgi:hypothetical protein
VEGGYRYGDHPHAHFDTLCTASEYDNTSVEWTINFTLPEETELVDAYVMYDYNSGTEIVADLLWDIQNTPDSAVTGGVSLAPQMEEWNTLWFIFEYADGTWEAQVYSICWPYVW